jgi:hypothetical protein
MRCPASPPAQVFLGECPAYSPRSALASRPRTDRSLYARALLRDLQLGRKYQSIDPPDIALVLGIEKMTGSFFQL